MTVQREARDSRAFFYPESRFGGFTDSDSYVVFYTRVQSLLSPEAVVLDIGCGRGRAANDPVPARRQLRTLKGKCRRVIGIDIDPAAAANTGIDEFRAIEPGAARWPVDDGMIDLALSISVLEHVRDPEHFFAECHRVLKPGGFLCVRTTNALSYSGIAARLIPNRYHAAVIQRVYAHPRGAEDVFPTVYRCNTVFKLRRTLSRFGFDHCVYGYQSQPSSLAFSRFFYFWGVMHQRLAPNVIKPTLFAFAQKNTS